MHGQVVKNVSGNNYKGILLLELSDFKEFEN
jgi:hypothetical protein